MQLIPTLISCLAFLLPAGSDGLSSRVAPHDVQAWRIDQIDADELFLIENLEIAESPVDLPRPSYPLLKSVENIAFQEEDPEGAVDLFDLSQIDLSCSLPLVPCEPASLLPVATRVAHCPISSILRC
jgi:hypothetical protein